MTIYFIRHGETDMNKKGIVQGSGVDADLNSKGRKQARLFYEYYKNIKFDVIYTSALKRTHQTVDLFLQHPIQKVETALLNEICWGWHEGQPRTEEMTQEFLQTMNAWETGDLSARIREGESLQELLNRIVQFIELLKTLPHQNILVCTHGRTLVTMMTFLQGHPIQSMNRNKHQNTCLYKVHYIDGEFMFELENDTRHLS